MVESRRHEQDIALPLLSNPEDPHMTTVHSGSEDWTHSSPHGKYSKWVAFPFRRLVQALLAIIALVALGFGLYGSFIGFHAYRRLVFPHRAVHASPATVKDGSRVVKPYFAPKAKGGVHNGTLLVKLWFRDGEKDLSLPALDDSRELDWEDMWRRERLTRSMGNIGETGYVDDTLVGTEREATWIQQFSTQIPIKDIEDTEDTVAHVILPGQTVYVCRSQRELNFLRSCFRHSLVSKSRSLLVATFELLPDPATIPSSLAGEHRSTRPTSLYGPSRQWPLPYSFPDPIEDTSLNAFFAHSSAGRSLKTREQDWRDIRKDDGSWGLPRPGDRKYATFLSTRTWVTMSSEYSIYGVDQYIKAQDALKEFKASPPNEEIRSKVYRARLTIRRFVQIPRIITIQGKMNVTGPLIVMGISRTFSFAIRQARRSNGGMVRSSLQG